MISYLKSGTALAGRRDALLSTGPNRLDMLCTQSKLNPVNYTASYESKTYYPSHSHANWNSATMLTNFWLIDTAVFSDTTV
jgi:hypothetical protein